MKYILTRHIEKNDSLNYVGLSELSMAILGESVNKSGCDHIIREDIFRFTFFVRLVSLVFAG